MSGSASRHATDLELLDEVVSNKALRLDVFAYDLNEPKVIDILVKLAKQGRVRVILDNATLHHGTPAKPEDQVETLFRQAAKGNAAIIRGKFGRFAHDKVLIVSDSKGAKKVLTGSTNLSVTGLYVNSNHVLVFDEPSVAAKYAEVFEESWNDQVSGDKVSRSRRCRRTSSRFHRRPCLRPRSRSLRTTTAFAGTILDGLVKRIAKEGNKSKVAGSVLFAVMQLDAGTGPVFPALRALHATKHIFSYGISDSPGGIRCTGPKSTRVCWSPGSR